MLTIFNFEISGVGKDLANAVKNADGGSAIILVCISTAVLAVFLAIKHVKKHKNAKFGAPSDLLKKAVCFNQGKVAEYEYLCSMFHKALRIELEKSPPAPKRIAMKLAALETFSTRTLRKICYENFKFLHEYFDDRHQEPPRICLKSNRSPDDFRPNSEKRIFTLARCDASLKDPGGHGCATNENTGFDAISQYGRFYIEQNIPKAAKSNPPYVNPRLITGAANNYKTAWRYRISNYFRARFNKKYAHDENWQNCWEMPTTQPAHRKAYKSTIIIPLTFWNNTDLEDSFLTGVGLFDEDDLNGDKA